MLLVAPSAFGLFDGEWQMLGASRPIKLSQRELCILETLDDAGGPDNYGYLSFRAIASCANLDPKVIRRAVRSLARKGFAQYGKGLWTDDGELAGAGYCCTEAGHNFLFPNLRMLTKEQHDAAHRIERVA
jgi:hypothetical protein